MRRLLRAWHSEPPAHANLLWSDPDQSQPRPLFIEAYSTPHPVCSHVRRDERPEALFPTRERSADEPERLFGAAPGERDARPAVPVVVDPRWAVGYVL
jgi:hypothetical protein